MSADNGSLRLEIIEPPRNQMHSRRRCAPKFLKLAERLAEKLLLESNKGRYWAAIPLWLLDDQEFESLPTVAVAHLLLLSLYVKRTGFNHLPNDPEFLARKVGRKEPLMLELLLAKGFLNPVKRKRTKGEPCADLRALQQQHNTGTETSTAHTTTDEQSAAAADAAAGCAEKRNFSYEPLSRHDLDVCRRFAQWQKESGVLISGKPIQNVGGLARLYHKEGSADYDTDIWLNPEKAPKRKQADPNCLKCYGSGMEVVKTSEGRDAARPCGCRKEAGE